MTQHESFDDAAAAGQAQWSDEVRVRGLSRLGQKSPQSSRRVWLAALGVLIVLHGLMLWRWYVSQFALPPSKPAVVQVRLIDEPAPPPQVPEPTPVRRTQSMAATILPTPAPARVVAPPSAPTAPPPLIYNHDGSVNLPSASRFISPHEIGIARGKELLARGHNIIHCRRSKFDNAPTPAQAAAIAASRAHTAHLVMGNPLDPLNDVGEQQAEDAAGEHAAEKRRIEEQACDY